MGDVGADIVEPRIESLARLGNLGDAAAHLLIDDLDRVIISQDVAPDEVELAFRAFDCFS